MGRVRTSVGQDVEYIYNAAGQLSLVRRHTSGGQIEAFQYSYNSQGEREKITYPNGTEVAYQYEDGRLKTMTHQKLGGPVLLRLTYTRDLRGLIKQIVRERSGQNNVTTTYYYDHQQRLTDARRTVAGEGNTFSRYAYDNAGNRLSKTEPPLVTTTYSYNSIGQLIGDGTSAYEYDLFGNLARRKESGVTKEEYAWSDTNGLTAVTFAATGKTVAFRYEEQNTRTRRDVTESGATDTTLYLTDYESLTGCSESLAELDATGTSVREQYTYGDARLAQSNATATTEYFHSDHLGSTRLLTSATGDAISGSDFEYSPYGDLTAGASSLTSYAFTGQYRDAHLNLQYHRARWLNTTTAGWLTKDPFFDFPGNFGSQYGYAALNPISHLDPNGLFGLGELNVSTAIQATIQQIVIPNVAEYLVRTTLSAFGIDPMALVMPLFSYVLSAFRIDALLATAYEKYRAGFDTLDLPGKIAALSSLVRIATVAMIALQAVTTVYSLIRLALGRSIGSALTFVVELQSLISTILTSGAEWELGVNPLLRAWEGHHAFPIAYGGMKPGWRQDYIRVFQVWFDLAGLDMKYGRNLAGQKQYYGFGHSRAYYRYAYSVGLKRLSGAIQTGEKDAIRSRLLDAIGHLHTTIARHPEMLASGWQGFY